MAAVQSPIIPIVADLIRQHPGTISLGQGVVYYPPPPQALDSLQQFWQDADNHKYKAVQGIPALQQAIATKLATENGITIDDSRQVVVTAGSNMGFINAVLAITQPGDEIILQSPYYFNHEMAVAIAGCRAVIVPTDDQYQLQLDRIQAAISDRTRAIVTISPNNPTGAVYPPADLAAVNRLCRDHGLYHISDEAYEYFTYDGVSHTSPGAIPDSHPYTISLYSLSKAYGFASWRIGYMVIPAHLVPAIEKIQDTILICPAVIAQYAAVGALAAGRTYCQAQLATIQQVRQQVLTLLDPVRQFCTIPVATGAFYLLIKVNTSLDSMTVVEQLIREYGVAVIPGNTFGLSTGCYLRVAYGALQMDTAAAGIGRLVKGLTAIAQQFPAPPMPTTV